MKQKRPMARLLAIVALGAVAGLIYMLVGQSDDGRGGERSSAERLRNARTDTTDAKNAGDSADDTDSTTNTGSLTATLKVLSSDGSPASGADLVLHGRSEGSYVTEADGTVELKNLHGGLYNVIARKGNAVGALSFELKKDTDLGTLRLKESIAIRGRILDSQGVGIKGATVEATRIPESVQFSMTSMVRVIMNPDDVVARAIAGDDGAYELLVPTGANCALRANASGYAQESETARTFTANVEGFDFYLFPGAMMSGRVTEANGSPIAGAAIMLANPQAVFAGGAPKVETLSAADGTFALSTTPARQLLLVVRAAGYAIYMDSNIELPAVDMHVTLEPGITLRLQAVDKAQPGVPAPGVSVVTMYRGGFAAGETDASGNLVLQNLPTKGTRAMGGQEMTVLWGAGFVAQMEQLADKEAVNGEIDLGTVELVRGGVITGRVTDRATGDGIGDVRIRSMGGLDRQLEFMATVASVTASDGSYELTGVPHKAHTILALHKNYISEIDPMQMAMSMQQSGGAPLFSGNSLKAVKDIVLIPAMTLTGQVLGPDGTPIAGAKVQVQDPMAMIRVMFGGGTPAVVTDAQGNFVLTGLKEAQKVKVYATHRDFGRSEVASGVAGSELTLSLLAPLMLIGTVEDEMGEPIAGVRVTVMRPKNDSNNIVGQVTGMQDNGAARPAISDKTGRYVVRNAPPGQLTVTYDHSGYESFENTVDVAGGISEHKLGKTTLKRGAGIEGVVVDEDDKPIANVNVNANWTSQGTVGAPGASTGRTNGQARTDKEGRYSIYGLRNGSYQLRVSRSGFYANAPVVTAGETNARIVLEKAASIVGRVMSGGMPVVGANISAKIVGTRGSEHNSFENQIGWANTRAGGVFRMESLPRDAAIQITIQHDAYQTLTVDDVRASEAERVFTLDAGLRVGGIVVDESGSPVQNVNVQVTVKTDNENNPQNSKYVRTGADGRFAAGGLSQGEITVELASWNSNYVPIDPITVSAGDTSIRIVARMGESISGTVEDASGNPLKQVNVIALDADAKQIGQTWIWDDSGTFALRGLPKGTYTIRVSKLEDGKMITLTVVEDIATGTEDLALRSE